MHVLADFHLSLIHIYIGKKHKAKPGDILGALAGESGLPGKVVGTIDMYDKYTFVEVPREYAKMCIRDRSFRFYARNTHHPAEDHN